MPGSSLMWRGKRGNMKPSSLRTSYFRSRLIIFVGEHGGFYGRCVDTTCWTFLWYPVQWKSFSTHSCTWSPSTTPTTDHDDTARRWRHRTDTVSSVGHRRRWYTPSLRLVWWPTKQWKQQTEVFVFYLLLAESANLLANLQICFVSLKIFLHFSRNNLLNSNAYAKLHDDLYWALINETHHARQR